MNKKEKFSFLKGKGASVGIVLCFVAVIAMVGTVTFRNYKKNMNEQIAKVQQETEKLTKENDAAANSKDVLPMEGEEDATPSQTDHADRQEQEGASSTDGTEAENGQQQGQETDETAAQGSSGAWFTEASILEWPASGATLIGYSMDQTVYFPTLEEYKYNPAMIIGGEVGESIKASATGTVSSIEETAQTGTTVTLDMGNGYAAVHGQLKDLSVSEGDTVATGEPIGLLNEPTKYYSVEGPNLYFKVMKDGEPVDPMKFME